MPEATALLSLDRTPGMARVGEEAEEEEEEEGGESLATGAKEKTGQPFCR